MAHTATHLRAYHGTDLASAADLLAGEPLDPVKAATLKTDGPPGFFLATDAADAEFFAVRQGRGPGGILQYDLTATALRMLELAGMVRRPIPRGFRSPYFRGDELHVPPVAFDTFNRFRQAGEVRVSAAP